MSTIEANELHGRTAAGDVARRQLRSALPVTERRLNLAGVPTALLTGGEGPPVILLHGPGGNALHWMQVIPSLVQTHRVIAPDLPGQGASVAEAGEMALDADRVLAWLGALIEATCPAPPALVGFALGGAIAARFASEHGDRLRRLVLVDTLGLVPFEPAPDFGRALNEFLAQPGERTHDGLWRHCARDLNGLRERMGARWEPFKAYNVDCAATPGVLATLGVLMEQFGAPAIEPAALEHIIVPTTLIWGRHDLATVLEVAESASRRYGWPLQVIDDSGDDPPIERPEAFLQALRKALGSA